MPRPPSASGRSSEPGTGDVGVAVEELALRATAQGMEPQQDLPEQFPTFRQRTLLSQHISFLKDFFRSYKDFTDAHIDTIELMLERLYPLAGVAQNQDAGGGLVLGAAVQVDDDVGAVAVPSTSAPRIWQSCPP